ncbi:hypothetical protein [Nonomuraea sp. NPDC003214]
MFEVSGYIGEVAYQLVHDTQAPRPIAGSPRVLALLEMNAGEELSATPTGPTLPLDVGDGASVLCALYALTNVTSVSGDVPDLFGPQRSDVVY